MACRKNMPERRQLRREKAAARFRIQTVAEFNNGNKGDGTNVGDYANYVERVTKAHANLQRNITAGA